MGRDLCHLAPAACAPAACRYLNDNDLTGTIPASWGIPGAFPALSLLRIDSNALTGSLPGAWGGSGNGGGSTGGNGSSSSSSLPNLLVL